jgi:hypothetical protein
MSLITIIYRALLLSSTLFFMMLTASYVAYLFRKKHMAKKGHGTERQLKTVGSNTKPKKTVSQIQIEEIKRIHEQTLAATRRKQARQLYQTYEPKPHARELRKSRYDVINHLSHNSEEFVSVSQQSKKPTPYVISEGIRLDFYRNT